MTFPRLSWKSDDAGYLVQSWQGSPGLNLVHSPLRNWTPCRNRIKRTNQIWPNSPRHARYCIYFTCTYGVSVDWCQACVDDFYCLYGVAIIIRYWTGRRSEWPLRWFGIHRWLGWSSILWNSLHDSLLSIHLEGRVSFSIYLGLFACLPQYHALDSPSPDSVSIDDGVSMPHPQCCFNSENDLSLRIWRTVLPRQNAKTHWEVMI